MPCVEHNVLLLSVRAAVVHDFVVVNVAGTAPGVTGPPEKKLAGTASGGTKPCGW